MRQLLTMLKEARAMFFVLLLTSVPAAVLYLYMSMHVRTALLEREMRALERQQELLGKKNRALRKEIKRTLRGSVEVESVLPDADRIVHIQLGETPDPGEP